MTFTPPAIQWLPLVPIIIVLTAGAVGVLLEAFIRSPQARRVTQISLALMALVAALVAVVVLWITLDGPGYDAVPKLISIDRQSLLWQGMLVFLGLLALLLFADRTKGGEGPFAALASAPPGSTEEQLARRKGLQVTEVFPLALIAIAGMLLFVSVMDLVFLFVALELFSLPIYILVATARRRRLVAQEASVKYFLLGAFGSAIFLFGAALAYGANGVTGYAAHSLASTVKDGRIELVVVAIVLLLAGLFFKLGAVPFHSWVPDVYEGSPTPVTAFMAALVKVAATAALLRVFYTFFFRYELEIEWLMWTVAVATMLLGSVVALRQATIKRMLAYSSISHAGFILVAFAGAGEDAVPAVSFYMLAYGLATLGAFAVITQVREANADGSIGGEALRLGQWAGLAKRSPLLAVAMTLFLLSFAGIPLTGGFIGKFVVFGAAIADGAWPLVLVAVLASAIAMFFYVRVIVLMYFTDTPEDAEVDVVTHPTRLGVAVVAITAVLTVILGVFPGPVLQLMEDAATFVVATL